MEKSRYLKFYSSANGETLIYSTAYGSSVTVTTELAAQIEQGTVEGPERETLLRLGILIPDRAAELEQMRQIFDVADSRSRRATVLVTLNLDCNLACNYCYEGEFRSGDHMTEQTADLLVRRLLEGPGAQGKKLYLDFYGGEPLLSLSLIRSISVALGEVSGGYSFTLVTNGTLLTEKVVAELLPLGLSAARVTLDGPQRVHDRQRPYRCSAGSSFATILENLKRTSRLLPVQLGGNFTQENYRIFPELLDFLLSEGLGPDRLSTIIFSPVMPQAPRSGMADFAVGCANSAEPWLMDASLFLRREILKRGYNTPKPKIGVCMVELKNDLVVGFDGSLYKCPTFMGWSDMCVGSLLDGVQDYDVSHAVRLWQDQECLECAYLPLCFGGCRYLQRLKTGLVTEKECRRALLNRTLEEVLRQDLTLRR